MSGKLIGVERVDLRPLALADAEVIAGWAEDPEFCRAADWTVEQSFTQRRQFHEALVQSAPAELIRLAASHEGLLVGYVDLHGDEPHQRDLGVVIGGRSRWGQGLGRLAAAAGLDYGFDRLGLRIISAEALAANQRSVRILQRLGMTETGKGAEGVFLDQPSFYRRFAITADEWTRGRTNVER